MTWRRPVRPFNPSGDPPTRPGRRSLGSHLLGEEPPPGVASRRAEQRSPGPDGMEVEQLYSFFKAHWPEVQGLLDVGRYACGATWNRTRDLCFIRVTKSVKRMRRGGTASDEKGR
jgi:hypothetical protein